MLLDSINTFSKDNLDTYLRELAKVFRKQNGKGASAEIILVGGAAILVNYSFRDMTTDVDAIIHASSSMKEAINQVCDQYSLPNGWLNADFARTASYSPRLREFSTYYKTFYGVLQVRSISAEYLIAMKLRSGRKYRNDLSDVIGILIEHHKKSIPISLEKIHLAVEKLYGSWESIPQSSRTFIEAAYQNTLAEDVYSRVKAQEQHSKDLLLKTKTEDPDKTSRASKQSILKELKTIQAQQQATKVSSSSPNQSANKEKRHNPER
jgi:predicted nucleotidyltransferase